MNNEIHWFWILQFVVISGLLLQICQYLRQIRYLLDRSGYRGELP